MSTMNIGIDCRFACLQVGLGRYTRELVKALLELDSNVEWTLFVRSDTERWLTTLTPSTCDLRPATFDHYSLQEQLLFPRIITRSNVDRMFFPHFNVPLFCPVPFIVTIHDLILHRYPNQASTMKRFAYRLIMQHAIKRSTKIIAVSQFTAREIVDVYGRGVQSKIAVIPEGIDRVFHPRSEQEQRSLRQTFNLDRDFFLYVGNAKEHKNVQVLIDAFADASMPDTDLVLVTGGKEVQALRLAPGVHIVEDTDDDELAALYSSARAFVTASLYEGFCLPILEAQACGCPVIATRRTAIPAVAGPDALLIEPDRASLAEAMASFQKSHHSKRDEPRWSARAHQILHLLH